MKIAVLSAYPLADCHYHRKLLLHELVKLREEGIVDKIHLLYGGIMPAAYLQQFQQMGGLKRVVCAFQQVSHKTTETVAPNKMVVLPKGLTCRYAQQHAIKIAMFRRYGDGASLGWFKEHRFDLAINLSGLYLPKKLLDAPKLGIMGGHYGALPDLRGGDTVRWTIYKNKPMVISHHLLAPQMDMGEILRRKELPVYRGDTIDVLRKRCQLAAVEGHIECLRAFADGTINRQPQQEADGQTYYRMGERLRAKTDQLLKEGRYEHFAA